MSNISIINNVKYNRTLFRIFKRIGSFALYFLKLFVIPNDKLILFVCFGGRKYDDSPRCIYETMLEDTRFDEYQLVWAFINPSRHELKGRGRKIKIDTIKFFIISLKARVWITNSNVDRGLSYKGKRTFYFNTWHGSAIKRLGIDMPIKSFANVSDKKSKKSINTLFDVFCVQSQYDVSVFSKAFGIPNNTFRMIGLARNDELVAKNDLSVISSLKKKLDIPDDKTIILYAPTFREFDRDERNNCILTIPLDLRKWQKRLGDQYLILFRAHYEVIKYMNIVDNQFVRNVSGYPNLNELMLVSDICISDYSSIFFDFSILKRPMICWAYDYDEYCAKRGVYFDIRKILHNEDITTEDDVISNILDMDTVEKVRITEDFCKNYVTEYGDATKKSLDIIADNLWLK